MFGVYKIKPRTVCLATCTINCDLRNYIYIYIYIQGDQKVPVHLMITIQKDTSNVQSVPASLQTFIDTRQTLTPSVIPNSNYVIMVSD
jgi:hypothetical protein